MIRKLIYRLATEKPKPGVYADPQPSRVLRESIFGPQK